MNKFNHLLKSRTNKPRWLRNLMIGVISAGAMTAGGTFTATALDDVYEEKLRILNCIGLLFTDPELHQEECGVGDSSRRDTLAPLMFVTPHLYYDKIIS